MIKEKIKLLWAPWREKYILGKKPEECIFCRKLGEDHDERNYILFREKNCFVILNAFPYNSAHLMVVPNSHVADMEGLSEEVLQELIITVKKSVKLIKQSFNPEGFNIGINMGKTAGAGIAKHLHIHIVPRWEGDTNFMPTIAQTKVISQTLSDTYNKIQKAYLSNKK